MAAKGLVLRKLWLDGGSKEMVEGEAPPLPATQGFRNRGGLAWFVWTHATRFRTLESEGEFHMAAVNGPTSSSALTG